MLRGESHSAHAAGPTATRAPAAPALAAPPVAASMFDWAALLDHSSAQLTTWMLAPTSWAPALHDLPIALMPLCLPWWPARP